MPVQENEMQLSFTDPITIDSEESDFSNFGKENIVFIKKDLPKHQNTESGTSTVQRYKEDPFSGFALGRLKIGEKRKPTFAIDPLNRGTTVHNAIAIFYHDFTQSRRYEILEHRENSK